MERTMHRPIALHAVKRAASATVFLVAASFVGLGAPDTGAPVASASTKLTPACATLRDVIDIVTESDAAAESQSPGWAPIQANGWTAFVPGSNWTITASDAGADINSTTGEDASLLTWYSLEVPWTMKTLGAKFTSHLTRTRYLCDTAVARSASGSSQAFELTGYAGQKQIQAVLILSMLTPTTETYVGESRYVYTPASQWSASNAETLALIVKRAIEAPQSLGD